MDCKNHTNRVLRCDMQQSCQDSVTHIDNKGFTYCGKHGLQRRMHISCRKLKPSEVNKLIHNTPIKY